ncbi:MAG TPA: DUF5710 domain-containing protein, partial [Atopostipes sp.]|nr:DUF5710 domain-containing protein [Atopostipes sp.]
MDKKGKLLLNVPYREKEEAKALGARWNPEIKKWYATNRTTYHQFLKWLLKGTSYIVFDAIYLAVAERTCFQCNQLTRVVGFSNPNYLSFSDFPIEEDVVFNFEDHISMGEHFIYNRP